jgi:hypothetical protein
MGDTGGAPPLPTPELDPTEVGRQADEILARPEFRPEPKGLVERALDAMGNLLGDLFEALVGGGGSSVVAWAILAVVVAAVAFLVVRLGRTVQRHPTQVGVVPVTAHRPSVEWRREAEEHEARGEWRQAMRCRYRALVSDLVARRVLRDVPGRTAGEYRAELAEAAPAVAGDFSGATELFELAWYGQRSTGPDESARFQQLADRVLVEAGS